MYPLNLKNGQHTFRIAITHAVKTHYIPPIVLTVD